MIRSVVLIGILFLLAAGFHQPPPSKNFSIQQLAPGVWAAIQNDKGGHAISNAGIVDLGDRTLVFDAFINPDAAAELKQAAEQLTKHPVSFVINSHFHDDHIRGDQAFVPGASIISTEWTRNEMEKAEPEEREWARKNIKKQIEKAQQRLQVAKADEKEEDIMWLGYYEAISQSLPKLKMILPDITFKDSMWIHGSLRSVLLVECHDGHTGSDAVMILPKEGIAFMGDILFVNRHPWFGDGHPDSLKKHLQRFYADTSLKQFVPGHGAVAGKESLQRLIQYINDLQQAASDAVEKGVTDSVFEKSPVLAAYKNWWFGRFYSDNLEVVYEKAKKNK
ncbi:MAG: MBL fold metallo-hydrolase [Chitinophagales bacterium]